MPTSAARLLALDAEITIDGGAYSNWPFTVALEPGQATGNLPGPYDFRGYRCRTYCVATNKPGFLPYRGVARTGVCFAMELMIDAIARAVDREPWEVRLRQSRSRRPTCPTTTSRASTTTAATIARRLPLRARRSTSRRWRERQRRGEPDGRLIGIGFASYCEQSAHGTSVFAAWGLPIIPGYDQATVRVTPDGGLEVRVGVHSHGQGMETTLAQIAHEITRHRYRQHPGHARRHRNHAVFHRHLCLAQHRDGGRSRRQCLQGADPALRQRSARTSCRRRRRRCAFRER